MLRSQVRTLIAIAIMCVSTTTAALAATPIFSAHKNGTDQTITADTNTKLTWSTEVFDTNSNFATDRFTPTVAGKYLIVVSARCAQPGMCIPSIYKNGALYARTQWTDHNFADQSPQATAIIDMNGSTDYVEAFIYSSGTVVGGTSDRTYFSGSQIDGGGSGGGGGNTMVSGWPDAIQCQVTNPSWGTRTLYAASNPYSDGNYYYSEGGDGASAARQVNFTSAGAFVSASAYTTHNCNVSIASLYSAGRAFNFIGNTSAAAAGAAGQVQFYEGGNLQADAGLTWDNSTKRLGIGTAAPARPLHISSTGTNYLRLEGTAAADQGLEILGGATSRAYFARRGDNRVGIYAGDGTTEDMTILDTGNVGIGTTTPASNLHVQAATGAGGAIVVFGDDAQQQGLTVGSSMTDRWGWIHDASNSLLLYEAHSGDGGTDGTRMTILAGGNVGFGMTNPAYDLDIGGVGIASGLRVNKLVLNDDNANIALRNNNAGATLFYNSVGASGAATAYRFHVTTSNTAAFDILNNGNVGINNNSPTYKLDVNGTVRLQNITNGTGVGTLCVQSGFPVSYIASNTCVPSDMRLKERIEPLTGALDTVLKLQGVTYYWNEKSGMNRDVQEIGFIAQDVEKVVPQLVTSSGEEKIKAVAYDHATALLVEAMKELKAANDNQAAAIGELRREIEALKAAR